LEHFVTVHAGHDDIEQHQIEVLDPKPLHGRRAAPGMNDPISQASELAPEELAILEVVVHHEQGAGYPRGFLDLRRARLAGPAVGRERIRAGGWCGCDHLGEQSPAGGVNFVQSRQKSALIQIIGALLQHLDVADGVVERRADLETKTGKIHIHPLRSRGAQKFVNQLQQMFGDAMDLL